jgi:type II secretory pathway pseudopilin PulG
LNRSQHQLAKAFTKVELAVVALVLGTAAYLVTPVLNGRTIARDRARCLANLGQIGAALNQYLTESGNHWPYISKLESLPSGSPPWPSLPKTLDRYVSNKREIFHCPADRRVLSAESTLRQKFSEKTTYFATEGTSYEWWFGEAYGGKKIGEESLGKSTGFGLGRADQPLLSDFEPFHKGDEQGAINTLNADLKPRTTRAKPKA